MPTAPLAAHSKGVNEERVVERMPEHEHPPRQRLSELAPEIVYHQSGVAAYDDASLRSSGHITTGVPHWVEKVSTCMSPTVPSSRRNHPRRPCRCSTGTGAPEPCSSFSTLEGDIGAIPHLDWPAPVD